MNSKLFAAAVLAAIGASTAQASLQVETLELRYAGLNAGLATQLVLPVAGQRTYLMGGMKLETRAPANSFLGYCVDPEQWASGSFHQYESMPLSVHLDPASTRYDKVTRLFGNAYADSLTSATKSAGFQLALWEVMNDDGVLTSGNVRITGRTSDAVAAAASSLLGALGSWSQGTSYDLTFYASDAFQDYISATPSTVIPAAVAPVPEPEGYALMLAGIAMLGLIVRRRG